MVASPKNFPLLAELLAEQQQLQTPVARFASAHASGSPAQLNASRAQLIPLSAPLPGEQYAFEVALDSCTGCKACVSACHSLNGLDEHETWRDVGVLVGADERHAFQQTVTSACHHCADPACLNGCPVLAYEKDPVTGIVRHLDDQCIGCQYCILKCPYDVPKYNARLGIVRKCDLCRGRLAAGEAPACVQACPTQAISIVTVPVTSAPRHSATYYVTLPKLSARADTSRFLAAAPDAAYTQPTTRYVSARSLPPGLAAADAATLRPQPAHWPLVIMLTLLPMAVGCQWVGLLFADAGEVVKPAHLVSYGTGSLRFGLEASVTYYVTLAGWVGGVLGLGASAFHLGRPARAWRIFLGWRTSWLSREAMVFGTWVVFSSLALVWPTFGPAAGVVGAIGLFCSVMIYVDTRRKFWRVSQTAPRFFGSALVLGSATAIAIGLAPTASALLLAGATLAKLACEIRVVRPLDESDEERAPTAELITARLLAGPFRRTYSLRLVLALFTGVVGPLIVLAAKLPALAGVGVFVVVLFAEVMERYLFFRAVDAPKMPGLPAAADRRRA